MKCLQTLLFFMLAIDASTPMQLKLGMLIPLVKGRKERTLPSLIATHGSYRKLLSEAKIPQELKLAMQAHFQTDFIRLALRESLYAFVRDARFALDDKKMKRSIAAKEFKTSLEVFQISFRKLLPQLIPTNRAFNVILGGDNPVSKKCAELAVVSISLLEVVELLTFRNFERKESLLMRLSDQYSALLHELLDYQDLSIECLAQSFGRLSNVETTGIFNLTRKMHLEEIKYVGSLNRDFARFVPSKEREALEEFMDTMRKSSAGVAVELLTCSGQGKASQFAAIDAYMKRTEAASTPWTLSERLALAACFLQATAPSAK